MTDPDPGLADARTADRFDVFLCSTRADPDGGARVTEIEEVLRNAGLRVFRDTVIDEFAPISRELADAIAGSRVLLVYYSRALPTRYTCQWELTAAFVAARRHGDPCRRVLAVNPEPGTGHLAPVELADAKFFGPVTGETLPRLVEQVRRKVADTDRPLGARPAGAGAPGLRPPARLVGRHRELWAVHSALHAAEYPGATAYSRPVLVLRGLPGVGKTALAEFYAYLFHSAFDGGTVRLGPFGHHAPEDLPTEFHLALADVASTRLKLDVSGLTPQHLRELVAEKFTTAREKVLVLIDDLPAGLPPDMLDQFVLPSAEVRTLITCRTDQSGWDAATLDLPGLTEEEGLRLFGEYREPATDAERDAVRRLVRRCGGHPVTVRANARAVQHLPGPLDEAVLLAQPDTAPTAIRGLLGSLGPAARRLAGLAALLAPVPFPAELAAEVLADLGAAGFAAAVTELVSGSVLSRMDGGLQLQALVGEVIRAGDTRTAPPESTAEALLRRLREDGPHQDFLLQHARAVADRAPAHRIPLLRPVAAAYETRGDAAAAGEIHAAILASGRASAADFTAAARVEITCGLHAEAAAHTRRAVEIATGEEDRYWAGLTEARAHDAQGDYATADRLFWQHNGDRRPSTSEGRLRAAVATARARRLRGRPLEAIAVLEEILPELRDAPPGPVRDELTPAARLELARNLVLAGRPRQAREVAHEVVAAYHASGRERHFRCVEAELVRAEAMLTLDLRDLRATPGDWERSAAELRRLERDYERRHGSDNPLTLTAAVLADRALLALGRPKEALAVLSATEQDVLRVLGADHQLRYRIRHGMALAHGQLREFDRQAELLEDILEPQIRLVGRNHPDTLETRLDLGIALAFGRNPARERAIALVDAVATDVVGAFGVATETSAKALAAQQIVRLPRKVVSALFTVERLAWPGRRKKGE